MRRRLATMLTAALLSTAVLLPSLALPAAASDTAATADTAVVLASQGITSDEGPDPMSPDDEDNDFAPPQYDPNWTWRAGKVLLAAFVLVAAYVGLMYYLRVVRPRSKSSQS